MEILIPRFSFLLWIVGLVNNSVLMVLPSSVAIQDGHHRHLITANLLTFEPRISVPLESSPEENPTNFATRSLRLQAETSGDLK